jgi:phage repressor protein C with HTH and peptisase S24 domain
MSVQNFSNYKSDNRIPFENILNFCAKKRISINWLLYHQMLSSLEEETMKYVGVKYALDIYGSCGAGAINYEDIEYEIVKFPWYMLENLTLTDPERLHIIKVIGESMEPELYDGEKVLIDLHQKDLNEKDIFAICSNEGVFIKRISIKQNRIALKSSNDAFKDETIEEDIVVIGKVLHKL